jgi:UDP-glucose 4-epimerase
VGDPKRVLVTGGAGYVGSVTTARLVAAGYRVTVLDDLSTGFADAVADGADLVVDDIANAARVLDSSYAAVLHFAAKAEVAESVADPDKYWQNNVLGSFALLRAMREAGVRKLVFSSSCAVYGQPPTGVISEATPTAPINPYGASKLTVDHMIAGECRAYGLGAVSVRYFNVAGAAGRYGERHDPESHLIPLIFEVAFGRSDSAAINGDDYPTPDGTCVRDYIHVSDLAEAHLLALDAARDGEHVICNFGNGNGFSVLEVIDAVRKVTGHPIPTMIAPRRPGDPAMLVASAERAREVLGWKPTRTDLTGIVSDAWAFAQAQRSADRS